MAYTVGDKPDVDNDSILRIFNVATGELKKNFVSPKRQEGDIQDFFKWSHDGGYLALYRPKSNKLHVYETENFSLVDNKALELPGLMTFEWSPVKNIIACYCEV